MPNKPLLREISNKDWNGFIDLSKKIAHGKLNGYSWLLVCKESCWSFEISEDQQIEPTELPLVGYGCGGWLAEIRPAQEVSKEAVLSVLEYYFEEFRGSRIQYHPAVSCTCSD